MVETCLFHGLSMLPFGGISIDTVCIEHTIYIYEIILYMQDNNSLRSFSFLSLSELPVHSSSSQHNTNVVAPAVPLPYCIWIAMGRFCRSNKNYRTIPPLTLVVVCLPARAESGVIVQHEELGSPNPTSSLRGNGISEPCRKYLRRAALKEFIDAIKQMECILSVNSLLTTVNHDLLEAYTRLTNFVPKINRVATA